MENDIKMLDRLCLNIFKGEIMGLVCLNSHGQDALIRLIYQNTPIHYGYIYFNEKLVNSCVESTNTLNQAAEINVHNRLAESLTVSDNVFVLRRSFKKYIINNSVLDDQLHNFTKDLGFELDPHKLVNELTFFEKCVTELLKAVVSGAKLIIVRDISNFISAADLSKFQSFIRHYANAGISFLYVCNHHSEAFRICDRIALMENGRVLKILEQKFFTLEYLLPYIGDSCRELLSFKQQTFRQEKCVLKFTDVCAGNISHLSFAVHKGECIVLLDINNTCLHQMIGLMNCEIIPEGGEIDICGERYCLKNKRGNVGFIAEHPTETMLFKDLSYLDNLCFVSDIKQPLIWRSKALRKSVVKEYEPILGSALLTNDIIPLSLTSLYDLVYFRYHLQRPKVVFCMQPFSGADMYLRQHIIQLINTLRERGIAVVILAVSLSDSLAVADRLLVVENGQLSAELKSNEYLNFVSYI